MGASTAALQVVDHRPPQHLCCDCNRRLRRSPYYRYIFKRPSSGLLPLAAAHILVANLPGLDCEVECLMRRYPALSSLGLTGSGHSFLAILTLFLAQYLR